MIASRKLHLKRNNSGFYFGGKLLIIEKTLSMGKRISKRAMRAGDDNNGVDAGIDRKPLIAGWLLVLAGRGKGG